MLASTNREIYFNSYSLLAENILKFIFKAYLKEFPSQLRSFFENLKSFLEHKGNIETYSKCFFYNYFGILLLIMQLFSESAIHFCTEAFLKN